MQRLWRRGVFLHRRRRRLLLLRLLLLLLLKFYTTTTTRAKKGGGGGGGGGLFSSQSGGEGVKIFFFVFVFLEEGNFFPSGRLYYYYMRGRRQRERERRDSTFDAREEKIQKKGKQQSLSFFGERFTRKNLRVGIFALALPHPLNKSNANEKEHKTMSFASVIANRAVLSVAATRAHAKSSNRRSLIVKAEGEEIAETETPAPAPAVSRDEDAKIFVDESFGLIFFTSGRAKRMSRRLNPRSKLCRRRRKGAFARRFRPRQNSNRRCSFLIRNRRYG